MNDSFRFHMWVKWTGLSQPDGGLWLRRRWTDQEWYACPRGEWCEIDVSAEGYSWGTYSDYYQTSWSSSAYFEVWGMSYTDSEFWYDPSSLFGCAYPATDALSILG